MLSTDMATLQAANLAAAPPALPCANNAVGGAGNGARADGAGNAALDNTFREDALQVLNEQLRVLEDAGIKVSANVPSKLTTMLSQLGARNENDPVCVKVCYHCTKNASDAAAIVENGFDPNSPTVHGQKFSAGSTEKCVYMTAEMHEPWYYGEWGVICIVLYQYSARVMGSAVPNGFYQHVKSLGVDVLFAWTSCISISQVVAPARLVLPVAFGNRQQFDTLASCALPRNLQTSVYNWMESNKHSLSLPTSSIGPSSSSLSSSLSSLSSSSSLSEAAPAALVTLVATVPIRANKFVNEWTCPNRLPPSFGPLSNITPAVRVRATGDAYAVGRVDMQLTPTYLKYGLVHMKGLMALKLCIYSIGIGERVMPPVDEAMLRRFHVTRSSRFAKEGTFLREYIAQHSARRAAQAAATGLSARPTQTTSQTSVQTTSQTSVQAATQTSVQAATQAPALAPAQAPAQATAQATFQVTVQAQLKSPAGLVALPPTMPAAALLSAVTAPAVTAPTPHGPTLQPERATTLHLQFPTVNGAVPAHMGSASVPANVLAHIAQCNALLAQGNQSCDAHAQLIRISRDGWRARAKQYSVGQTNMSKRGVVQLTFPSPNGPLGISAVDLKKLLNRVRTVRLQCPQHVNVAVACLKAWAQHFRPTINQLRLANAVKKEIAASVAAMSAPTQLLLSPESAAATGSCSGAAPFPAPFPAPFAVPLPVPGSGAGTTPHAGAYACAARDATTISSKVAAVPASIHPTFSIGAAPVPVSASVLGSGFAPVSVPGSGTAPGTAPGTVPGTVPDPGPGPDPGTVPDPGPGPAPGPVPDPGPGAAPGAAPGASASAGTVAAAPTSIHQTSRIGITQGTAPGAAPGAGTYMGTYADADAAAPASIHQSFGSGAAQCTGKGASTAIWPTLSPTRSALPRLSATVALVTGNPVVHAYGWPQKQGPRKRKLFFVNSTAS